jgi:hypothetical protein
MKRKLLSLAIAPALFAISVSLNVSPLRAGDKAREMGRNDFLTPFHTESFNSRGNSRSQINFSQGESTEEKSILKAVLYSLLLPGMGELYAGGFSSGKYFLMAESGLWLTFASFEVYGHWVENDARRFAGSHASAQVDGKDDLFFVNVANFNNVYEYNEKKLRDRDLGSLYDPNSGYFWQWDNDPSRLRFRDLRVKADNILNNVKFVGAAIAINHIASAINAGRLAVARNKETSSIEWDVSPGLVGGLSDPSGLVLTVRKTF